MNEKQQTSSTQLVLSTSPSSGEGRSERYFRSSVDLKEGLEVVEHGLDDLPSAFQGLFSLT